VATENKGFIQLEVASVSLITDVQQYYYTYRGRREATRNNCRSLAVMVNFCGSHHSIRARVQLPVEEKVRRVYLAHRRLAIHIFASTFVAASFPAAEI
jgi:hypothetical protein